MEGGPLPSGSRRRRKCDVKEESFLVRDQEIPRSAQPTLNEVLFQDFLVSRTSFLSRCWVQRLLGVPFCLSRTLEGG